MLPYPVRSRQVYRDQAIPPAVELPHPMLLVRVRVVVAENSINPYKLNFFKTGVILSSNKKRLFRT